MQKIAIHKNKIALFIALLFHICGLAGILFTPYKQWFINNTPLTLLLMVLLLIITQPSKNIFFYFFLLFVFVTGIGIEIVSIHTGNIFGHYSYGNALGAKLYSVPYIIGINWFIIIYCVGIIIQKVEDWVQRKIAREVKLSPTLQWISFITDAALLSTFFDWVIEPVATKLGFWSWQDKHIPMYNYVCWFVVSALLLVVFRLLPFRKHNQFAVHLFIIQLLFFLVLQTFL